MNYSPAFSESFFSLARLAPAHSSFDFCFPAKNQVEFETWCSAFPSFQEEGPYLNFTLSETWIAALLEAMEPPLEISIDGHLRDSEVARALREPRKQIRRFVKLFESSILPEHEPMPLEGPWRALALALLGFAATLRQARTVWSPTALGAALKGPLKALQQVWEQEPVDPADQRRAAAQLHLLHLWKVYFQAVLIQITP